jgi:DNA-binding NarL/FixJ family response regulator
MPVPEPAVRIAIVDDHPVARCGMEHIFDLSPGIEVASVRASLAELSSQAAPDVVILDLYLGHGRLSPAEIAAVTRTCPVLVVSASARRQDVLAAIRAGASGYILKTAAVEAFAEAVRAVAAGGFYVSSQLADLIDTHAADAADGEPICLAPREREALSLIAQGFTQSQAASRMGISPATIDTYIKRIRHKLGPGNKADLTRRAIEFGEQLYSPQLPPGPDPGPRFPT